MGWNESVLGGVGIFNFLLILSSEVVGYFMLLGLFFGSSKRFIGSFLLFACVLRGFFVLFVYF